MSGSDLSSIPLPSLGKLGQTSKKTAKEMLQDALHDSHKNSKDSGVTNTSVDSKSKMALKAVGKSSQSIVDELFKDFIAQKFNKTHSDKDSSVTEESNGLVFPTDERSVDEISKILDMEINSIQKCSNVKETEGTKTVSDNTAAKSKKSEKHHRKSKKRSRSDSKGLGSPDRKMKRNRDHYHSPAPSASDSRELSNSSGKNSSSKSPKTELISNTQLLSTNNKKEGTKSDIPSQILDSVSTSKVLSSTHNKDAPNSETKETLPSPPASSRLASTTEPPTVLKASLSPNTSSIPESKVTTNSSPSTAHPPSGAPSTVNSAQPELAKDGEQPAATDSSKIGQMLPNPLAKKLTAPKQLGLKLTSGSLSLIKSHDRVDRDGRVWEEGEVQSSHSEDGMASSESEPDGHPSETGSINSNPEDWRSQADKSKKKHKHKHKKKKKKSSKDKDKDKDKRREDKARETASDDKRRSSRDGKSGGGKHSKEAAKHGKSGDRTRSRSTSREASKKRGRDKTSEREEETHHSRPSADRDRREPDRSNRSRSNDPKRQSHSRSKSPKHHRRSHKSRSRSKSPKRSHYNEWDARHYSSDRGKRSSKHRSRSRSKDRSSDKSKRKPSSREEKTTEKETREQRLQIDKAKLRRIAIANALVNMKAGQGPQVDMPAVKSGGKSVQELTEFCKKISEKGNTEEGDEVSDSSEEELQRPASDDDDTLIHHPFKIKEPSATGIVMNIRNSRQLPVLTPLEKQAQKATLRLAFPVSSGSHHRASESPWVPVERPSQPAKVPSATPASSKLAAAPTPAKASMPLPDATPIDQIALPQEPKKTDSIFPDTRDMQNIDIGSIISERLQAVRKLQENPYDVQALSSMHKAQEQASKWATSKHLPGQFTGSTGAKVLSQAELIGDKKHQAWARKTQLSQAAPVTGGIGMFLLQKMGWKHGEGLGKNNEGKKEPLMLDVKVDRKGLSTAVENPQKKAQIVTMPRAKDLSNKHPVSALMELCNRRKWGPPCFTVVDESGPDHKKNFLFKVKVNNIEYQPAVPSSNKKTAKAECAAVCLQELGLIPRDAPLNI